VKEAFSVWPLPELPDEGAVVGDVAGLLELAGVLAGAVGALLEVGGGEEP
jgi:hypothetical protein